MKLSPLTLAVLAASWFVNVAIAADKPAQTLAKAPASATTPASVAAAEIPKTPDAWLQRMTDFRQNGSAFKDPRVFAAWSNAITEPNFYPVLAQNMLDPNTMLTMLNSAASPAAVQNMAAFADPQVSLRWAQAAVDPRFYTMLMTQFADPNKMVRWILLPTDPRWLQMGGQFINPNLYLKWGAAPLSPQAWNFAGTAINPGTYAGMATVAVDPKSYGQASAPAVPVSPPVAVTPPVIAQTVATQPVAPVRPAQNPWLAAAQSSAVPATASTDGQTVANTPAKDTVNPWLAAAAQGVSKAPASEAAKPSAPALTAASSASTKQGQDSRVSAQAGTAPVATLLSPVIPVDPNKHVLATDSLFKGGRASVKALTPVGKKALDAIAAQIKKQGKVEQVVIAGHADPTGNSAKNRKLSQQRARAVKEYLTAKGVKSGVIVTSGLGDAQLVVKCDPKLAKAAKIECNAPNRRVEIEVRKAPPK